jgi:hypothetical protein
MSDIETVIEGEVVEVSGTEIVPRQAAVTLFRTDDPGEVVARATAVANALSAVLEGKKLYKRINQRNHVFVEGWTLCGSMLGVFPVVAWSRKLENGWEARAEARTLAGELVGAAEAECLRSESKWSDRDDYAIRSMAQTRAISKALKLPLGFIVVLAGFDATPAEEMVAEEAQRELDTGKDLLPGAIAGGQDFLERLGNRLYAIDASIDWRAVTDVELGREQWQTDGKGEEFWRRMANAAEKVGDLSSFPPPSDEEIVAAFAWAFDGVAIELTRPVAEALDAGAADAADADEEPAPLGNTPLPDASDDDVPFGEEEVKDGEPTTTPAAE